MNMKLARFRRIWILVLAVFLAPVPALAGDEAKPEAKPDKKERIAQLLAKPEVLFGNDFDIRGLKGPERGAIGVFRYERELRKLYQIMLSELKLTDLQKEAIRKLVNEQIAYVKLKGGAPRIFSGRQHNPLAKKGSPYAPTNSAMDRAEPPMPNEAGAIGRDRERKRPDSSMYADATALINLLSTELSGLQIEQFKKPAYRWKVLRPFGNADGPLRQLSRAVRDPYLTIEDEQRTFANKRVQQAMAKLGRDRQHADKRVAAYEEAKADIAAKLAPAHREHFEKTLKELQTEFAGEVLLVMDMRAEQKKAAAKKQKPAEQKP